MTAAAQPDVPPGLTARKIAPLLDGQVPQLSAIDDPGGFGTGVVTAAGDDLLTTVRLISPSGLISSIGVIDEAGQGLFVIRVRLAPPGPFAGQLFVTLGTKVPNVGGEAIIVTIDTSGTIVRRFRSSGPLEGETYDIEFIESGDGVFDRAGLLDLSSDNGGSRLSVMDDEYQVTIVNDNSVPPGRTDTDAKGYIRDHSGRYGGGILLADTDDNDFKTAIYSLADVESGGVYSTIYGPADWNERRYGDLAIAASGDFGGVIYITETLTDEIQQVAPDGTHTTWATGFIGIDSLSISPDGNSMYVGDLNGVWLIRATGSEPGPVVLATEPSVPPTSQLTGNPISSFRVMFNEPVSFDDADVTITNAAGDPVGFDASGSASQFMLIGLAEPLFADTYTVTIADTLTSVATGEPLDGDNDGFSGGDAVLAFNHRCPGDFNADGTVNTLDVLQFLNAWTAGCP